jgi:hypothetical protein
MALFIPTITRFNCPTCGGFGYESPVLEKAVDHGDLSFDPYEGEYCCGHCGEALKADSEREAKWFSIAYYTTDRVYGGPEEGGWYYTYGDREDETVRVYENTPEQREMAENYLSHCDMMNRKDIRFGWEVKVSPRVYAEALPDSHFPKRRPVYC